MLRSLLQGDIQKMERLYDEIDIEDVIETDIEIGENRNIFNLSNIVQIARDYVRKKGFNNEPLKELLQQNLDIEKIYQSEMDFGMVTYSIKNHKPVEIFKGDIQKEELIPYILASACFPIYKAQKIGDNVFMDGGLYDNLPINMLIKKGYNRFIVVDISGPGLKRSLIHKDIYMKLIRPCENLGGVFEFNRDRVRKNLKLGYLDTLKAFCKLQGHQYYFKTEDFKRPVDPVQPADCSRPGSCGKKSMKSTNTESMISNEFLEELWKRHTDALARYEEVKKVSGIPAVIKEYEKIRQLLSRDLILCFFLDKFAEEPIFNGVGENLPFADYITAGRAMLELQNMRL